MFILEKKTNKYIDLHVYSSKKLINTLTYMFILEKQKYINLHVYYSKGKK